MTADPTAPEILDSIVRDGGYAIDFSWNEEEIAGLVTELSAAGLGLMEVGHGLGLDGSRVSTRGYCTDEEHVQAAAGAKGNAKVGTFFIPGIGTEDDLHMLKDAGGDFVRVGTEVSRSEEALPFWEAARALGLEASFNFMKSYTAPPFDLLKRGLPIAQAGRATWPSNSAAIWRQAESHWSRRDPAPLCSAPPPHRKRL